MLARAAFAILVMGLIAAGVLSIRQARLQAAHELTQARLRAVLHDERLAEKRALIADLTTPDRLVPEDANSVRDPDVEAEVDIDTEAVAVVVDDNARAVSP
ncbi:MAG: hypothetical protein AAF297_08640 [Planctomycetota bacterium]